MKIQLKGSQYSITLPKKVLEAIGWEKGDEVSFEFSGRNKLMLIKESSRSDNPKGMKDPRKKNISPELAKIKDEMMGDELEDYGKRYDKIKDKLKKIK